MIGFVPLLSVPRYESTRIGVSENELMTLEESDIEVVKEQKRLDKVFVWHF